jgi:hypothetical protein
MVACSCEGDTADKSRTDLRTHEAHQHNGSLTENRSPAFAPALDADAVDSMRVLTADYPAEYGRKLGGVIEVTTEKNVPSGLQAVRCNRWKFRNHERGCPSFLFAWEKPVLSHE